MSNVCTKFLLIGRVSQRTLDVGHWTMNYNAETALISRPTSSGVV